jgi:hypothetical protein
MLNCSTWYSKKLAPERFIIEDPGTQVRVRHVTGPSKPLDSPILPTGVRSDMWGIGHLEHSHPGENPRRRQKFIFSAIYCKMK